MSQEKIEEQFHYFNIHADIDSVYGNWAVSTQGDVVNCLYPYAIISFSLNDCNWIETLRNKVWFLPSCEDNLKQALERAMMIKR